MHLHDVGGKTIDQTFYQDVDLMDNLHSDVIFVQVERNDISDIFFSLT